MDAYTRHIVRVPADSLGQDQQLAELGFEFRPNSGDDSIYRTAILPRGWKARGLVALNPLEVVDRLGRLRVVMKYGTRPVLQSTGRTGLVPVAAMRLLSLREYLVRAVADGTPVLLDSEWCTPERIHRIATAEAARAEEKWAYFARIDQNRNGDRFKDRCQAWDQLANRHAPILETAA